MCYSVSDYVCRVDIGEFVDDFTSAPPCLHETRASQDPEMLTHQRLRHNNRVYELVDAVGMIGEEVDHSEPNRGR